jgi:adenylate cyclase
VLSSPILSRLGEDASLLALGSTVLQLPSAAWEVADCGASLHVGEVPVALHPEEELALPSPRRQPLAILAIDVAGYSQMIETDDLRTALRVRSMHRCLLQPAAQLHGGWIFSVAGDGTMAAFPAAAAAVGCAVTIQRTLDLLERDEPAESRIRLRMGISFGSVLQVDGELYGRALNIAARLETLAEPGGIYLSGAVFDQAGGLCPVRFEPLGERRLDKISTPRRVYRVDPSFRQDGPW